MENDDEYIKQLEDIFNEFRTDEKVGINEEQLQELCKRLRLDSQCIKRIFDLALPHDGHKSTSECGYVTFEHFCECFVAVLSEVSDTASTEEDENVQVQHSETVEEKVKPRLVRGGRAYGRKSVPNIDTDLHQDLSYTIDTTVQRGKEKSNADNWAGDMVTSSDEADLNENNRYYGEDYPNNGAYFEANGIEQKDKKKSWKALLSNDNHDSLNNLSSASVVLNEVNRGTLFTGLDYDNSGSVESKHICEMWKQAGVENPMLILQALDFEEPFIDAHQLSTMLEKEALSVLPSVTGNMDLCSSTVAALIASYQSQLLHLNNQIDHNQSETEKMREDLERSEIRNSKLLEEVDDRYLSMDQQNERKMSGIERKWMKKLSSAQRGFEREKESLIMSSDREREAFQKEIDALQSSTSSLRRKLDLLRSDNESLSAESSHFCERLNESEKEASRLRKDLECLLTAKTAEPDNMNSSQEEKFAMIIKEYEAQCRQLRDRNDELLIEVESLHGRIRQEEVVREHNITLQDDLSPKRKKALRRGSTSEYFDRTSAEYSDFESDGVGEVDVAHHHRFSHPDQSENFAGMRMLELERQVEELKEERRLKLEQFSEQQACLKADLQKEYQIKLEKVKSSIPHNDDNRAYEDQQIMTMQLLKEMTQQKDELERKYLEMKESCESNVSNGQEELANLCREFASEKADLVAKHEQEVKEMESQVKLFTQQLADEQRANERTTELLQSERDQHQHALIAHQEIIAKFEKTSAMKEEQATKMVSCVKLEEVMQDHQVEINCLKQKHHDEMESVQRDLQTKLDQMLSEKHKFAERSSMCSELERLEESVQVERQEMHERIHELREAFEREALELQRLLDCDKAKLRKQLSEETASLKQKLAEETEKEMKKKRQLVEECERLEREKKEKHAKENLMIDEMKGEIEDLQARNKYLDDMLSKTRICLEEEENRCKQLKMIGRREDFLILEERVQELDCKIIEKEKVIKSLKQQLAEQLDCSREKAQEISNQLTNTDVTQAENIQLKKENNTLVEKVRGLEKEQLANRIEHAGLMAKCEHLSAPVPSPRNKYKRLEEERLKEKRKLEEKIQDLQKEVDFLRTTSPRSSDPPLRAQITSPDVENDTGCYSDTGSIASSSSDNGKDALRLRLNKTRSQLTDQMRKTRDVYNKLSKTEILVKDLYCENAHLMKALQVTEARQRDAERKLRDETDKNQVLGRLLKQVCPDVV